MDRELWKTIKKEIKLREDAEPSLGPFLHSLISSQTDLLAAVASILSSKLHSDALSANDIKRFILEVYRECVPEYDRNGYNKGRSDWECFELVFPVTYEMPDGSTLTVTADDEEGWSELKDWYEENNSFEEPLLQYPVDIIYEDEEGASTAVTINNSEEMREAKAECLEWDGEDSDWECFELVFPVTYEMPDGSTLTVTADDEEGWSELKDWYEENNSFEEPLLQYPVDIIYEDEEGASTAVTINNSEEMREAKAECLEWDGEDSDWECFEIILPVTVIMPDGSIMIIEDEDEGWLAIRNWYEENDSDEEPFLQYPVDILYEGEEDDVIVTINSDEEWIEAEEECYGEFERP